MLLWSGSGRRSRSHGRKIVQAQCIAILGRVGHVVARMHVAASGDEQAVHQLDDVAGVLSVCLGAPAMGVRRMGTAPVAATRLIYSTFTR